MKYKYQFTVTNQEDEEITIRQAIVSLLRELPLCALKRMFTVRKVHPNEGYTYNRKQEKAHLLANLDRYEVSLQVPDDYLTNPQEGDIKFYLPRKALRHSEGFEVIITKKLLVGGYLVSPVNSTPDNAMFNAKPDELHPREGLNAEKTE